MLFGNWLTQSLFPFLLASLPGGLWMAFWLFAVNWKKAWPTLREGAWAPLVLVGLLAAIVWSQVLPGTCPCGVLALPNFWWQLVCVALLIGCALFSGWLQGVLQYSPVEIAVEPAAHHDHGHAHSDDHAPAHNHGHGDH